MPGGWPGAKQRSHAGPWPDRRSRPPDGRGARAANHRGGGVALVVRETHRQRAPPPLARSQQSESRLVTGGNSRRRLTRSFWPVSGVSSRAVVAAKAAWATATYTVWRRGCRMNGHGFSFSSYRRLRWLQLLIALQICSVFPAANDRKKLLAVSRLEKKVVKKFGELTSVSFNDQARTR